MATKPVVVGVDGSDDSKAALKWAVEYGQRYEAP
ncbi:universal stress protein, partial [Arthrobacter rhombi]